MSKMTEGINRISLTVISISAKIAFYVLAAAFLVTGVRTSYQFGHSIFYAPAIESEPGRVKTITLDGSESVSEVGDVLFDAGLIRDDLAFTIQAYCYEYKVRAGTYELSTALSSKEIIGCLSEGTEEEKEEE